MSLLLAGMIVLGASAPVAAQTHTTIYRCTDASGALLLQNDQPCPPGHAQQIQVIDVPPPLPAHVPREVTMPHIVAAERAAAEAAILATLPEPVPVGERTAPPALYQCTTWDNTVFLTEDETPAKRCAPMRVVGLDGRPQPGMGAACQATHDQCEAIPEDTLCDAWHRRVDEAEFRWKFAGAQAEDPRRRVYAQLAATLANSTCAR